MKPSSLIISFALLGVISFIVWGCGGWFAHKNDRRQQAQTDTAGSAAKTDTMTAYQLPIDSLIKTKVVENGYTTLTFDTAKCKFFPDFTRENIFTLPKYKALFGWTDDYTVEPIRKHENEPRLMYKNVPYEGSACSYAVVKGRIKWAQGLKFIPRNEPSEIKISIEEARKIALEQEFLTRKGKLRKQLIDSLGYLPEKYREILADPPLSDYAKETYLPNAKFVWEKKIPIPADSIYYPKGELVYVGVYAHLVYVFEVYAIAGSWGVVVDAVDGSVYNIYNMDPHNITCEPANTTTHTTDYLWYYNGLSPMPNIDVSGCNFGTCTQYRFANANPNNNINAFCQEGTFSNSLNLTPHKSFVDWSSGKEHYSPNITVGTSMLPTSINSTDGAAAVAIAPAAGVPATTFTYSGNQIITSNGLVNNTIVSTTSGSNVSNLSAGIYELTLTNSNGCVYTEYFAIGFQGGASVTASTPILADCYNNAGNIHLSIDNASGFSGQNPQLYIKGAINTSGFIAATNFDITSNKFELDLHHFNANNRPLPPGNYAILVRNPSNNTMTGVNIRLEYPDCEVERKLLQTAYWAIERTHQFFKGNNAPINGGASINITLPLGIVQPLDAPAVDDGHSQFSHDANPIGIGLLNDEANNASFVGQSTVGTSTETLFRIARGNTVQPIVALDVLAHEYGHAINAKGVNIKVGADSSISPEADAINEGFSDIVGAIVEATSRPTDENWVMGDATMISTRNMANPAAQGLPSIYNSDGFLSPTFEQTQTYGLEYIRSLVFSHWFYLLSHGGSQTVNGTPHTVPALGIEKAGKITLAAFVGNQFDLNQVSNKNYHGLCRATTRAANALFPPVGGTCSPEVSAVREAWQAVGLDCWGTILPALCEATCPTPVPEIQLTTIPSCGQANNGEITLALSSGEIANYTYSWTGPDGFTSSEPDIYNLAPGNYTVVVTAIGNPDCTSSQSTTVDDGLPGILQNQCIVPDIAFSACNGIFDPISPICANALITISDASIGADAITGRSWDIGGSPIVVAQIGSETNVTEWQLTWTTPGTYNVTLNITPETGATAAVSSITIPITVVDGVNCEGGSPMEITYLGDCNPVSGNYNLSISVTGDVDAESYTILGSGNNISISDNYTVTAPLPNQYTVIINDENGCIYPITGNHNCEPDVNCGISQISTTCTYYPGVGTIMSIMVDAVASTYLYTLSPAPIEGPYTGTVTTGGNPFGLAYLFEGNNTSSDVLLTLINSSGCTVNVELGCNETIVLSPPVDIQTGTSTFCSQGVIFEPINLLDQSVVPRIKNACPGEHVYLPYFVTAAFAPPVPAVWSSEMNLCTQTSNVGWLPSNSDIAYNQGNICYIVPDDANGLYPIRLYAKSGECVSSQLYLINVSPLPPTLSFTAQEIIPAQKGCNGQVWQSGSVAIMPDATQYSGSCKPPFTVNGIANPTQPVWADGMNYYEVNYQGQTQTVAVNIPAIEPGQTGSETDLDVGAEIIPATRHSSIHGCWVNECDGRISLSTIQGGSGNYSYRWSDDCECSQYATDSPNYDPCCAVHTNLCHGCYTVTISDNETGCQTIRTYNVGVQVNGQTYYSICNTYPDNTVVNNTVGQTFTMATLDPKLQIYPSAFDVLTNVKYEVKEDSYVSIRVYNLQGMPIETIVDETFTPKGEYILTGEGNDYSNGLYIFVLETCEKSVGKIGVKY